MHNLQRTSVLTVAVPFVTDFSESPNIGNQTGALRFQTYWKCIFVALASAKILGGAESIDVRLFSDSDIPREFKELFNRFRIKWQPVEFSFRPPEKFSNRFLGSLFLLDALRWISLNALDEDKYILVDPDCFVSGSLARVAKFLEHSHACIYALRFPKDYVSNGQSLSSIERWVDCELPDLDASGLRWIGGEFLALTGAGARVLFPLVERVWRANLEAFSQGRPYLMTEEHVLSVAFSDLKIDRRDVGGEIVRRLWTARSYYNLNQLSQELPIWHLPSEKTRGFLAIYDRLYQAETALEASHVLSNKELLLCSFGFKGRRLTKLGFQTIATIRRIVKIVGNVSVEYDGHS